MKRSSKSLFFYIHGSIFLCCSIYKLGTQKTSGDGFARLKVSEQRWSRLGQSSTVVVEAERSGREKNSGREEMGECRQTGPAGGRAEFAASVGDWMTDKQTEEDKQAGNVHFICSSLVPLSHLLIVFLAWFV